MKTIALNPEVLRALVEDFTLYAMYRQAHGHYDSDIVPLHNPDFVRAQKLREVNYLQKCEELLKEFRVEFAEHQQMVADADRDLEEKILAEGFR